jgi:flagellar M-ring protein FliF
MIKKAVAGAIVGLTPEKVMVANLGDGSYLGGSGVTGESFDDPYYQHRIAYEQHMKSNIEELLSYIPGIRVQVTAELDDVIEQTTRTTTPDGEPAPLRETRQDTESQKARVDVGGQVGLTAQGPSRSNEQNSDTKITDTTRDGSSETENIVGTKDQFLRQSGLVPKHVRAGIAIPRTYLVDVWRERQRRKGEDLSKPFPEDIETQLGLIKEELKQGIGEVVVPLLPKELAKDLFSDVKITFFESLTPDPIEPPAMTGQALAWAGKNFNTILMAGIALVSLLMLRSMVKAIPPAEPIASFGGAALSFNVGGEAVPASGEEAEEEAVQRPRLKLKKGTSLKDDLTEIVREDPDAAASILRGWISNAG